MTVGIGTISKRKKTNPSQTTTLEAYFNAEENALSKSEFHNGKIAIMAGGTLNHSGLSAKTIQLLGSFIDEQNLDLQIHGSDLKIRIENYNKVVYPDALVICEKPTFFNNRKDTITNPSIIVEVLSDSTGDYDRTTKFEYYKSIDSFKEYVLIYQDKKQVVIYTKQEENTWIIRDYVGENAIAILNTLQACPLPLTRLYRGIEI